MKIMKQEIDFIWQRWVTIASGNINCEHFDKNLKSNLLLLNNASITRAGTVDESDINDGVKNSDKSSNTIGRDMGNVLMVILLVDSNFNLLITNSKNEKFRLKYKY